MNAHTKQQQDKVFETDFIDSQKSDPPFAHPLALSRIQYIYTCRLPSSLAGDKVHLFGGPIWHPNAVDGGALTETLTQIHHTNLLFF